MAALSVVVLKGRGVLRTSARTWGITGIAGVAVLRETSILFAVLIGWLVFGEKMDRGKETESSITSRGLLEGQESRG